MSIPYDYEGSAAYGSQRIMPVPAIDEGAAEGGLLFGIQ